MLKNCSHLSSNLKNIPIKINLDEYIFCIICALGSVSSLINISVLTNPRLKDTVYKYFLASSIIDLFYTVIIALKIFITCGTECDNIRKNQLSTMVYILYFQDYLTSCFAINNILIEIFVSLQRFFIISNRKMMQHLKPLKVVLGIFMFTLVYYSPLMFMKEITSFNNNFKLENTQFGTSSIGRVISVILTLTRLFLASVFLFAINWLNLVKFNRLMRKKMNLLVRCENLMSNFLIYYQLKI